uniref:Uncharacterized protein n=1 Tax=Octopus bimaculoides TaxID=37653 RepID=A0A0L8IF87_OCTBM
MLLKSQRSIQQVSKRFGHPNEHKTDVWISNLLWVTSFKFNCLVSVCSWQYDLYCVMVLP